MFLRRSSIAALRPEDDAPIAFAACLRRSQMSETVCSRPWRYTLFFLHESCPMLLAHRLPYLVRVAAALARGPREGAERIRELLVFILCARIARGDGV
jgi:hypothetical protein